jgi:hypothetical protein
MRLTFRSNDTVQVFRLGTTTNKKIAEPKEKIVQSYTFSKEQFEYVSNCVTNKVKPIFKEFFALDAKNCFDCPFSINSGNGGCYTHKVIQYSGFISMLKSINKEFTSYDEIPTFNPINHTLAITKMAKDRFVRFGSYGEPTLHPIELVETVSDSSKNWTGYTHQWHKNPEFAKYFMASVHNKAQEKSAKVKFNFRSFVATKTGINEFIQCPASKEGGLKSNCSKCGLCSGTNGKGSKSVIILVH